MMPRIAELIPILDWGRSYGRADFRADLTAGVIVLFITIPQVIAYAYLAGMPPETGLYAAILSLIGYAAFGSSKTLAVGPAAIISMMTLESVSRFAEPHTAEFLQTATQLAVLTGMLLIVLRILNFGTVVSFLSHAVATGFIAAAAILIIITQLPTLLGLGVPDRSSIGAVTALIVDTAAGINFAVVVISAVAVAILVFCKLWLGDLLRGLGLDEVTAANLVRPAPMYVVMMGVAVVAGFSLDEVQQVAVVGDIPGTAPNLVLVSMTVTDITLLLPSALLMAMVIFLESMSVGAAVASKRREKIDANQELVGLGFANIGAGLVGGFPVAGSFARTVVNHSVGAASPLSGVVTAVLMIAALVGFSSLFYFLPKAILSAIIVVSAAQLIDVEGIRRIFAFNPIDGITFAFTFVSVLVFGVETGILIGIVISFVLLIRASSKPHIAIVGRWGDTEHFRNVQRHEVITSPRVLAVRIDESLYFVNTRYIETFLLNKVAESQTIEHVLLICTATNFIDSSGLEMLEQLSANFASVGVTLHLSEVKGPVMDRLRETDFYAHMSGKIFFTTDLAMKELAGI